MIFSSYVSRQNKVGVMIVVFLTVLLASCSTTKVKRKEAAAELPVAKKAPSLPPAVQLAPQVNLPADSCVTFASIGSKPPVYIEEMGFVVTTVQKPCITYDGQPGFYRDSSWVAMGIPCSDGGGKVEWKGKVEYPKVVSFVLSTDCPMTPGGNEIAKFGVAQLGFDNTTKLLAHNPFILQFWAIPSFPDAGTGFTVDLRSRASIDTLWAKLKKQEPINVHLYGRENAWLAGNNIYFIDANIIGTTEGRFRLEILDIKHLNEVDIAEAKRKCDLLRPKRSCHLIF